MGLKKDAYEGLNSNRTQKQFNNLPKNDKESQQEI